MNNSYLNGVFNLQGKVAALTGGAGFLMSEMAKALGRAGCRVLILDVNLEAASLAVKNLAAEKIEAQAFQLDVTSKQAWQTMLNGAIQSFGGIDILINGAGLNAPTPFMEIEVEEWNRILEVQLTGTMLGCQVVGAHMLSRKKGSIINISSASSGPPLSKAFTYSVAKAGVKNLTQNLAREWATQGVRVNALRPGFFPTEWSKQKFLSEERIQAILSHTPMKRFGEPVELTGAVLWLAGDAAGFVTGAEIAVDGGFTAMTI